MSTAAANAEIYVLPVARARESVSKLLGQEAHPFFVAYLYLRGIAGRVGRLTGLSPNWPTLGTLLEVLDAPPGKPYLRPFWKGSRAAGQEWLNANLAGSFAPSSLRGIPQKVIEIDAAGKFNLRPDHPQRAFQHLLSSKRLPALAVAGFLFRDYGILSESPPTPEMLIALLRQEYGYRAEDDSEFNLLYDTTWTGEDGAWAEAWRSA
jgi:hypothetical protein